MHILAFVFHFRYSFCCLSKDLDGDIQIILKIMVSPKLFPAGFNMYYLIFI